MAKVIGKVGKVGEVGGSGRLFGDGVRGRASEVLRGARSRPGAVAEVGRMPSVEASEAWRGRALRDVVVERGSDPAQSHWWFSLADDAVAARRDAWVRMNAEARAADPKAGEKEAIVRRAVSDAYRHYYGVMRAMEPGDPRWSEAAMSREVERAVADTDLSWVLFDREGTPQVRLLGADGRRQVEPDIMRGMREGGFEVVGGHYDGRVGRQTIFMTGRSSPNELYSDILHETEHRIMRMNPEVNSAVVGAMGRELDVVFPSGYGGDVARNEEQTSLAQLREALRMRYGDISRVPDEALMSAAVNDRGGLEVRTAWDDAVDLGVRSLYVERAKAAVGRKAADAFLRAGSLEEAKAAVEGIQGEYRRSLRSLLGRLPLVLGGVALTGLAVGAAGDGD